MRQLKWSKTPTQTDQRLALVGHRESISEKSQYIKDGNGKIIGQVRGDWILNAKSEQVARFDRGINRTRKADASIVGFGDQRLRAFDEEHQK